MKALPEYDLHGRGMLVDDATSELDRLISRVQDGPGPAARETLKSAKGGWQHSPMCVAVRTNLV